jgi:hypothetical protein
MKRGFPGFKKCMAMMRQHGPAAQDEGFHWLLPHASDHLQELMAEFDKEKDHGLRCWLLELIGSARSPRALNLLAQEVHSPDESLRYWALWGLKQLDTKEARRLVWEAGSCTGGTDVHRRASR